MVYRHLHLREWCCLSLEDLLHFFVCKAIVAQRKALSVGVRATRHLFTKIRDKNTTRVEFCSYANRLMTMICEEGLSYVNPQKITIVTPTGSSLEGESIDTHAIVAVSIIRAGDSLLDCFIKVAPAAHIGKILIQRDEETHQPVLFYSKLPSLIDKQVVLCDPMLATGGSAKAAISVLLDNGAVEENILFLNVVACPEGIDAILSAYPKVKIVTGEVDAGLNEKKYIVPGLGDYGDRFYGTH